MKLATFLIVLVPQVALAAGRLSGQVVDDTGRGVPGAQVLAQSDEVTRSVGTGLDGNFALDDLLPGAYRVTATASGRASGGGDAVVADDAETIVSVAVGGTPPPSEKLRPTHELYAGLPLWSRSPQALLRLNLAARGRVGATNASAAGFGDPDWQLDGIDFTHPITGAPLVSVGFESLAAMDADEESHGVGGVGPTANAISLSGSNRWDTGATALGQTHAGSVEGSMRGPALPDRLWFTLAGADLGRADAPDGGRLFGQLTWQVTSRNRVTSIGAWAANAPEGKRAWFVAEKWESVLTDELVLDAAFSAFGEPAASPALVLMQGQARLSWFLSSHALGEQELKLSAHAANVSLGDGHDHLDGGRSRVDLGDDWRPTRFLTIGAKAGYLHARAPGQPDGAGDTSGALFAAWDATHDQRTAVRARAGRQVAPALLALACPTCAPVARVDEAALGTEREFRAGSTCGIELLGRRGATPMPAHEALLALHARHGGPGYRLTALYELRWAPSPRHELLALASVGLLRWLSLGATVLHAERATWAPLFDETRGVPLGAPPTGSGWLLGLQLHAELGQWLGVPASFWIDALNLANDRGTVVAGATPIHTPAPQLRLGLRVEL